MKRYPYKKSLSQILLFPPIVRGLAISMGVFLKKSVTLEYPEVKTIVEKRFRGEHYLKKDQEGHIKCVACYMCATACPSRCIDIVAEQAPVDWHKREKRAHSFEINMLRCIFCGLCVEACPKDAIAMSTHIPTVYDNRNDFIYNMEKLLAIGDQVSKENHHAMSAGEAK